MNKKQPEVLAVEDKEDEHALWRSDLRGKVVLISALTIEEAERQFLSNPGIVAIVMDACVPGNRPNTEPLVQKLRTTFNFTGPIIAVSSVEAYQEQLMLAGCDHKSMKYALPEKLLKVLGL